MKRFGVLALLFCMVITMSGCAHFQDDADSSQYVDSACLDVVTSYGEDDGNYRNYQEAIDSFQKISGITIRDHSSVSSEEWKQEILTDFMTDSEPDVLFYFANTDAEPLIRANKVVSVEEIRENFPDYAQNLNSSLIMAPVDGMHYAVPSTGFWESMFVNKRVLDACGVKVPGPDYTWSRFMEDCSIILEHGYTPISCSLIDIPNYWFEFAVMNNGSAHDHYAYPHLDEQGQLIMDATALKWIHGLEDIRDVYERGFFSPNTLSAKDNDTVEAFAKGEAAFLVDGSWKVGYFLDNYPEFVDDIQLSYFPGKGQRAATDLIGGVSMGYFITRKAWANPAKRDAAVRFVSYMTSDTIRNKFITSDIFPLGGNNTSEHLKPIQRSVQEMLDNISLVSSAVQDHISGDAKRSLFLSIQNVVTRRLPPENAIETALRVNENRRRG